MKFKILVIIVLQLFLQTYGSDNSNELEAAAPSSSSLPIKQQAEIRFLESLPNTGMNPYVTAVNFSIGILRKQLDHLEEEIDGLYKSLTCILRLKLNNTTIIVVNSNVLLKALWKAYEFNPENPLPHNSFITSLCNSTDAVCKFKATQSILDIADQNISLKRKRIETQKKQINSKIQDTLQTFLYENATPLYGKVKEFSEHSFGRLAGVALYYDRYTVNIALGRKALTTGNDRNHHVERSLINQLFRRHAEPISGHLLVYTPLPPCNAATIGCISYYGKLAQYFPDLRITVLFDHEYEDKFDYTSLNSGNLTFINRIRKAKEIEEAAALTRTALQLQRATSDVIIANLSRRFTHDVSAQILEEFPTERRERLKKKLLAAR